MAPFVMLLSKVTVSASKTTSKILLPEWKLYAWKAAQADKIVKKGSEFDQLYFIGHWSKWTDNHNSRLQMFCRTLENVRSYKKKMIDNLVIF